MRAALAELDEYAHVEVFGVAVRAAHDAVCGCDSDRCRDQVKRPTRSELVAARRAMHALARRGMVTLSRGGPASMGHRLCSSLSVAKLDNFPGRQHISSRGATTADETPPTYHPYSETRSVARLAASSSAVNASSAAPTRSRSQ
jgi:hypothetical protein